MKQMLRFLEKYRRQIVIGSILLLTLTALLVYRLGTLTPGLSLTEYSAANAKLGWHGLYHNPFYLPLTFVRSVVFFIFSDHGQLLTRLPNTLFGLLAIISFAYLIKRWHGVRTAFFATALFATSAWFLHISRLASFDVLYLTAMPMLILSGAAMHRDSKRVFTFYGSMFIWGAFLYVPGLVWLVLLTVYWQRGAIVTGWKHYSKAWQRIIYLALGLLWLPLLVRHLLRPHQLIVWFGFPQHLAAPLKLIKQFVGVFVHMFVRGPQYPELWLAKVPILDVFTLVACLAGLYFYIINRKAQRSRLLLSYFIIGVLLVGLHGPVSLALMVPLLYIVAGTGIAYLLYEWLQVFPLNPLARGVGIGLMTLAVCLSCVYNLRAYFVAWPHNQITVSVFHYRINKQ